VSTPLSKERQEASAETAIRWAVRLEQEVAVVWALLVEYEHDALRWEKPLLVPGWTQRIRQQLNRPWVPDCWPCATSPGRYFRDRHTWPTLYGWTREMTEMTGVTW
jgi:hypothetical protein